MSPTITQKPTVIFGGTTTIPTVQLLIISVILNQKLDDEILNQPNNKTMQITTTYPVYQFDYQFDYQFEKFKIHRYETCFYPDGDQIKVISSINMIPDHINTYITIANSWSHLQKIGCIGWGQHQIVNDYHALAIAVLRWAIENGLGDTIPLVYRGVRDDFPDNRHLVIFGSPDLEVAKFYGDTIKEYHNVKGIKYIAACSPSVVTGDYDQIDEEVIFFPDQNKL